MYAVFFCYKPFENSIKHLKRRMYYDMIAPSTFHKMSNNEYVSLDVLVRICSVMKCGLDDIVEMER